ncbi:FGGY-family carbohydrate kinase [Actibacterium sp. 188UL27-1]|uniref:xylulokinase n=1 Tax=Actibacterium sp. 188UL27-1 TaxID=2786961 RepID=UPI00195BE29C|nr:FGGY family carbohydrate kinase [Actibacterium sp. 188UL27-1]MBM7068689.1 hypothetical protein [Actibacterium sp. 188UL27-1]
MTKDIVIGIDSSTQSTKAIAWDMTGCDLAEGRAPIPLSQPGPGRFEQDPQDWWTSCCTALNALMTQIDPNRVAGLAIANQRETLGLFDTRGDASHPAVLWLDERCVEEVTTFAAEIGADLMHQITGRPPDLTPAVYTMAWFRNALPQTWAETAQFLDVHGFLTQQLTGKAIASTTSIDAYGVFDIARLELSDPILGALGLTPDNFAPIQKPGTYVGDTTRHAADQTSVPAGTPIFVGGGDGQCAGLGVNATAPGAVYLNLGTAVITGASASQKLIRPAWRTITSQTGEGFFMESCLRAGTFLIDWLVRNIGGKETTPQTFATLQSVAQAIPVGSSGVTVSPYLSGCMDPYWNPSARASFHGFGAEHSFAHLYRATLEAVTLQSARFVHAVAADGLAPDRLIAVGGGSSNALWTQMLTDATGLPLVQCLSREASSLGAGISAAVGAGLFDSFDAATRAMVQFGDRIDPDPTTAAAWSDLSARQERTYRPDQA